MSFTGVLGTFASQPGNVELGTGLATTGLSVSISESLNLVESATYPLVAESASDTISLVETATIGRRVPVTVSETIPFAESQPWVGPHYETAASRLNLAETAAGRLSVINLLVSEGLLLVENAGRHVPVTVAEVLALVDSTNPPANINDVMALIEAAFAAKGVVLSDVLSFTEAANVAGTFGRTGADAMTLVEVAAYFLSNPSIECTYTPFIGTATGSYTPPSATPPTLGTGTLTLTWPYSAPTSTLVLRNPDWGNDDKLTYNRLNQTTRGGTLVVFADPQWPKFKTLSFQIQGIPDATYDALVQFLEDSLGQEIGLLDWEGRNWRGIITNPDTAVSANGVCKNSVSIEFEGDLA